jgi:hypothetical protein
MSSIAAKKRSRKNQSSLTLLIFMLKEIAAHVQALMAAGTWQPRVDQLPYYDGPIPELGAQAQELAE